MKHAIALRFTAVTFAIHKTSIKGAAMNFHKGLISIVIMISVCGTCAGRALSANLPNFVAVNYGPFHKTGQNSGTPIPDAQFLSDLGIIAKKFSYIRTYGLDTASRLNRVAPLVSANFPNMKVFLGVYEDGPNHAGVTQPQLDLAISQANAYPNSVKCVVVGNECLTTDSTPVPVSLNQLMSDLQYVRKGITNKNTLVTTCLGYQSAIGNGTKLMPYCDVMMVNIYPFYGQVAISQAWSNLSNAYKMFAAQFSGKQVMVGETGWPSVGPNDGNAVPSIPNEQTCITQILANAGQMGPVFLFEAFDEPWKSENAWAPHWGIWDTNGNPKISIGTTLTRDAAWIGDQNGDGAVELGLLSHDLDTGMTRVYLKDGRTGRTIRVMTFFGAGWTPVALVGLPDLNSNKSPELAVLGFNEGTGAVQVMIKDTDTGEVIRKINFDGNFKPRELAVRGKTQLTVLGTNADDNTMQVEVRNALTGALVKKIGAANELY